MIRLHLKKQICMEVGCMLDKWFADLNDMHKMVQLYFRNKQYKTLKLYIQRFEKKLESIKKVLNIIEERGDMNDRQCGGRYMYNGVVCGYDLWYLYGVLGGME